MPSLTAATLFRQVDLLADGPLPLGRPVPASGPGLFIIELGDALPAAPIDISLVGKWIERVPGLTLDGEHPTSKALAARLGSFWLPSQRILYVGASAGSIRGRIAAMEQTSLGDRKPANGGHWLKVLRMPATARLWWAPTTAIEEYEDAVLAAFAEAVTAEDRKALPDTDVILPWANLRRPTGERKATGMAGSLLAEPERPAPPPAPTRIVKLPDAEADGARDEAKRPRRPAPGRGVGKVASAAAYAAQGSPRRPAKEPVQVSPEGLARLEAELETLKATRPEVIRRIATAREHGDLKENAEYHAAREEGGFLEGKIQALEAKLRVAEVVAPTERGARVELGSHVRVDVDGDEVVFQVVGGAEADSREGRISSSSPVGAALMGRKVGDIVTIITPGGSVDYGILSIE